MHAGPYWNWFAFDSTLITQMHQGAVVPAGPRPERRERPSAAAGGCIGHVATKASKDVFNSAVGIRPGALNGRCPSATGDGHPLSIGVGFELELPTWNMNWVKDTADAARPSYDFQCAGCHLAYAEAERQVRGRGVAVGSLASSEDHALNVLGDDI